MDKRFFLALFLSLVVIAVSQLLFPTPKTVTSKQIPGTVDSALASGKTASSSAQETPLVSKTAPPENAKPQTRTTGVSATGGQPAPETVAVNTAKAIYSFTNVGASPLSIIARDY